jgi:oligopeptide transport system substrate-binding protein
MDRLRHQHPGEYLSVPDLSTYHLRFDLGRPPFDDRRVRRAFGLATDRSRLAGLVLGGHVFPSTGGQVPPGMGGHSPGIALPYSPPEARQMLAEAGYPGGRGFPPVELLLAQGREAVITDLSEQWLSNLGVQVSSRALPWAALVARAHDRPPHILGMGSGAHYPDPATFVGSARRDEEQAAYMWRHAGYDRLAAEIAQVTEEEQRLALFRKMDRIVVEEAWMVPLWYGRRHLLVKPWIARLPTSPIMGCFWKDMIVKPHTGS